MLTFLILAGGSGDRFWPLSTNERPKQLIHLFSDKSLLRKTIDRILPIVDASNIFVCTNNDQVQAIYNEIPEISKENYIIEPMSKDTAAAIFYSSTIISSLRPQSTICVLPSDHMISDEVEFRQMLQVAEEEAVTNSNIVMLGINPSFPETRFTYLEVENKVDGKPCKLLNLTEKPNLDFASKYYANGNFLLNTGMLVFKSSVMDDVCNKFAPEYYAIFSQIIQIYQKNDENKDALIKQRYALLQTKSINSVILRKAKNVVAIPCNFGWNDVGSYMAIAELFEPDEDLNIILNAAVVTTDSQDNIIIGDNPNMKVALMGINNKIIVYTKDKILICEKNRSHEVKELIRKF